MTREEAIAHASIVRNKSKNASMICLDAEVIDALLASPWHNFGKDNCPKEADWYFIRIGYGHRIFYDRAYFDPDCGWLYSSGLRYADAIVIQWMAIPD